MRLPGLRGGRRGRLLAVAVLLALTGLGGGAYIVLSGREGDTFDPSVEFEPEPEPEDRPAPAPPPSRADEFVWPVYGYSKARTSYLPVREGLRPPLRRRWTVSGQILLEFPPVLAKRSMYLLKNNGALYAIAKDDGRVRWKRKLGALAASSPAYAHNTVYVVILERGRGVKAGRVAAISTRSGRTRWSRKLPSRAESSPLIHRGRVYFGTEDGTVYSLRASNGEVRWRYRADGAVKGALALSDNKLYFGDYAGKVHAIRTRDGSRVWVKGTSGGSLGLRSGNFYSTPAVAFGRVYLGNTDGNVYAFGTRSGKLAWRKRTGGYVYSSPAAAHVPGLGPTVYIGSYDGHLYALHARDGKVRWRYRAGGRISGGPTVIGDIVYFANLGRRSTSALGARTGRRVWAYGSGSFNPVVSDGRSIFLTGYGGQFGFRPSSR
jgi:outer membrane protein assembly factor BamB